MSHSPTKRYYDSRPSSRPTSPQNAAEVRSAAVAKLKRAASLPRRTETRRPSQPTSARPEASLDHGPDHSYSTPRREAEYGEEVLSPSPTIQSCDQHVYGQNGGLHMQRSASAASSFHLPTPPHLVGYSQATTPTISHSGMTIPDWTAMQLAQSYLPSLSPVAIGHSPYMAPLPAGRNTPSPLPTLGELRTLQRSNSAAARAKAMDKLTGGRETPVVDELSFDQTPTKPGLQRADSLGAPRMLGGSALKITASKAEHPPSAFVDPKPRLQRSFTVSSSNMGEERRSAVGRRMVARLGERRAVRDTDEDDVRRLWEERRGMIGQAEDNVDEEAVQEETGGIVNHTPQEQEETHLGSGSRQNVPELVRYSPTETTHAARDNQYSGDSLGVPEGDRPFSRTTQISEGDAFEYEFHLRRSLSSRTARGAVGTVTEAIPSRQVSRQDQHVEHLDQFEDDEEEEEEEQEEEDEEDISNGIHQRLNQSHPVPVDDFTPPKPPFITPSRHIQRGSTSTDETQSPGGDSTISGDGLQSMLFVMGSIPGGANGLKRETGGFPIDVDEGATSTWGTPAKDLSQYNNHASSPLDTPSPSLNHTTPSAFEDTLTPPEISARSSVMSWEELGGEADREIPSDIHYHKKSGSISSKVGRAVKGAMRKRSQSRSSGGSISSPPTSPKSIGEALTVAVQNFSRRGSQSSVSPSQSSIARSFARGSPMTQQGEFMRHQPSVSSLAPSVLNESSANGLLLQHQLSNDPQSILDMPRAKIDDPRVFNSKLSPFPGIKPKKVGDNLDLPDLPRLVHQNSDSAVPSQQRVTPQVADSIHSLPLPVHSDHSRRGSDDSIGRKGWLAKAFGSTTSPRSSAGTSWKSSITDSGLSGNRLSPEKHATFAEAVEIDPFAAPPPPPVGNRSRAISPSVSTVAEANEENRTTQFTVHRSATHTPVHPDIEEEGASHGPNQVILEDRAKKGLPPKSLEILARMDEILALSPEDPNRPEILDDPPRKLLLATQVLQVVNMNTVKDRYLLLFNDILVICKPVIEAGPSTNLDMRFIVKSIVSLDRLLASGFTDDPSRQHNAERDAILKNFTEQFASDPFSACTTLIERNQWRDGMKSLANVMVGMPELDKAQLGIVLSKEQELMAGYIDALNFGGTAIDDALRLFLLSVKLPAESNAAERLLYGFAQHYHEANKGRIAYDVERAHSLVTGMLMLNDSLHGSTFGFAMLNSGLTISVWVAAFRERDPGRTVETELLHSIYTSIQGVPLQVPLTTEQRYKARTVYITPEKLPSRLTINSWSEPITLTLPMPDLDLRIKLQGQGLEVEPAILDFTHSTKATFRIRGTEAGTKTLLLSCLGINAPLYSNLPTAKIIQVERSFMKHTFHLSFANHLGMKRRYCFSLADAELRTKWGVLLPRQISITRQRRNLPISTLQQKIRNAAEAVSLVVLRDALIPPPVVENGKVKLERTGSFSIAYAAKEGGISPAIGGNEYKPGQKEAHALMQDTTGKEVVLVCRQNSLLPGMLELLHAGIEPKDRGAKF